ncbi:uncharacterized protein LOC130998836 [Salvia miltiorrhiza]|uniref:uncharacterized protein LOC130998836 n=1 Tax=Salvia miltiorrhiza TaxID=226208 RepID=UPI0025ACE0D4|nr:uncharacterized protein LOC130998836 [Salvia miltiorrhiza]
MQNQVLSEAVVQMLMKILEINPYAKFFRRLKDYPSMDNVQLHISKDVNLDQRVYNSPHADQVAAIWVEGNNENIPLERDIVVHAHSGDRHRIKHYYGCYDPLQYPLLFPMGETGWHQNIRKIDPASLVRNTNYVSTSTSLARTITAGDIISNEEQGVRRENVKNVSCREYICYKIQIRNPRQSIFLLAGRLLQQYIVDMYIKLETTRLDYYRQNQSTMRVELYQGIVDSVFNGELRGNEVGKRIVLPATFIGGPRDMRRRYLDALTLVQRFGKPDLFITMTCNPEWKEIQQALYDGQTAQERPDLTTRVFRAKLQDLKYQLFKRKIFGHVAAHVDVVEFQKRGLPHVHMLVIFKSGQKLNTTSEIDKFENANAIIHVSQPIIPMTG